VSDPPDSVTGMPITPTSRVQPPATGDEATLLRAFLDYYRATLRLKAEGLDGEALTRRLGPSDLTLGGLLKHMALVEQNWFRHRLIAADHTEPWRSVDWEADRDWELHSAAHDSPEELFALFDAAVADSEAILEGVLSGGLDQSARRTSHDGEPASLRWILIHMIEEYARHCGHADLIRESIDGQTGD